MKTHHKIILGDCLEGLELLDDESVDLVVTSPPYFNSAKRYQRGSGVHYSKDIGEPLFMAIHLLEKAYRVVDASGFFCINLGFSYGETGVLRPFYMVNEILKRTKWFAIDTIIWHKNNPIPLRQRLTNAFEYIFVLAKHPLSKYPKEITYEPNVWKFPIGKGPDGIDIAVFPEELPRRCIETFSREGDVVLDPLAGSFTTSKVAMDLNRNSIAIEINPDYWENIGRKRLNADIPTLDNSVTFEIINLQETE